MFLKQLTTSSLRNNLRPSAQFFQDSLGENMSQLQDMDMAIPAASFANMEKDISGDQSKDQIRLF